MSDRTYVPTHRLMVRGKGIPLLLCPDVHGDGPCYTLAEWSSETTADYEIVGRKLLYQGQPVEGRLVLLDPRQAGLRARREAAGIRREALAVAAGISVAALQRIEQCRAVPTRATLAAIEAALDAHAVPEWEPCGEPRPSGSPRRAFPL